MEFQRERVYSAVNADELRVGDKVIVANHLSVLKKRVQEGKEDSAIALHEINGEDWACRFGFITSDYALAYLVERKENCTNCGEGKWDAEHKKILCDPVNCGNGNVVFRNHEIEVCEYYKPIAKMPKTEQKAEQKVSEICINCEYSSCSYCNINEERFFEGYCRKHDRPVRYDNTCPDFCLKNKKKEEKHYRPFKDTDELIKVWCEHKCPAHNHRERDMTMPLIWVRRKEANTKGQLITEFGDGWGVGIGRGEAYNMTDLWVHFTFLDGTPCGVEV